MNGCHSGIYYQLRFSTLDGQIYDLFKVIISNVNYFPQTNAFRRYCFCLNNMHTIHLAFWFLASLHEKAMFRPILICDSIVQQRTSSVKYIGSKFEMTQRSHVQVLKLLLHFLSLDLELNTFYRALLSNFVSQEARQRSFTGIITS